MPSEVLPTPGRADEAQDRALQLVGARLHRQVLDDALLDLVETVVLLVEDLLGLGQVLLDLALDAPGDRQQPVEVVAHHGGLGRHRAHLLELLELGQRLVARLLGELGVLDLLLELLDIVALVAVAQLLLNGLHLLVQIVLALGLLHLPLDARADLLLHLQDGDLALHQRVDALEPARDHGDLEDVLLVGDLDGEMRGDGVGELGIVLDLADGAEHLGEIFLLSLT
jgi:hypothetical protein